MTICIIGELLVEFLAKEENQGPSHPGESWGPYPNGAPAISVDQVAKLGFDSVLFSYVGSNAFGEISIAYLRKDGVNISGITMLQRAATSSAFVSYRNRAQCDFIFNMPNNACGLPTADRIGETLLSQYQHFHITGSSLLSFRTIDAMRRATENIKGRNGTASLDPNIRKEILSIPEVSRAFEYTLDYTDIFLPSNGELDYFGLNLERNEQILVGNLLKHGVEHMVIKRGPRGASHFSTNKTHHVAGFNAPVVDPTGVRGCFGATFVSLFLNGATLQEASR